MLTKTFSARADSEKLAYADELARREYGMSFGQYCGSVLLDLACKTSELPKPAEGNERLTKRKEAWERMKARSGAFGNPDIAAMSDAEIKELVARRYQ